MKSALVISLNFNPGHVSHLIASYKQCEEIGYLSTFYVNHLFEKYLPPNGRCLNSRDNSLPLTDIAIFLFPSEKNLPLIWEMKRKGVKIIYVFHEPLSSMSEYKKAGFSFLYLLKLWIIDIVNSYTVKLSDIILLPSKKAVEFYVGNPRYKNVNYHYIPLMYDDECEVNQIKMGRVFFSYIGTIAADHSFTEFINFIEWALLENKLPDLKFLIATKSSFDIPNFIKRSNRVIIQQGRPLSNEEINSYYASSYCVWNAYNRTTQSGVLAKSFMFGTPAIILKKNLNEFTCDRENVIAISDNTNMEDIALSVQIIKDRFDHFSHNCRLSFLGFFYYKKYNEKLLGILSNE